MILCHIASGPHLGYTVTLPDTRMPTHLDLPASDAEVVLYIRERGAAELFYRYEVARAVMIPGGSAEFEYIKRVVR